MLIHCFCATVIFLQKKLVWTMPEFGIVVEKLYKLFNIDELVTDAELGDYNNRHTFHFWLYLIWVHRNIRYKGKDLNRMITL